MSLLTSRTISLIPKIIGAILYSIIVTYLASFALKAFKSDENGITTKHQQDIRSLIITPTAIDRLSNIGGLEEVKTELKRWVLLPLKHPDIFYNSSHPSIKPLNGVLLHGPPGTGKTMLAKAIANESNVPFISLHAAALENKWWGESSKLLNAAFTLARTELAPCIIFFDEIDGLGRVRTEMDQSCVYSFKCELLRNMDGIESNTSRPVIVLGCTNCVHSLDPALRRRFGRTIHITLPNETERYDILLKLTRNEKQSTILKRVSRVTEGMSGADLATLFAEASMYRMNKTSIEEDIEKGHIKTSKDLEHQLGELTWEHWSSTGKLKERLVKFIPNTPK